MYLSRSQPHDLSPGQQAPALHVPMIYERANPPTAHWEYRVETVDLREKAPLSQAQLNELGRLGWLLVGILQLPTGYETGPVQYCFVRDAGH